MQNKNLKIIFSKCPKWVFITCGVIVLAAAFAVVFVIFTEKPEVLLYMIIMAFPGFLFGTIMLLKAFIPEQEGLSVLKIANSVLQMTIYNKEGAEYNIKIPLQDIEKFNVKIDVKSQLMDMKLNSSVLTFLYLFYTRDKSSAGTEKEINVAITIRCKDGKDYNFSYTTADMYKIQQLFSAAKFLPNFSYEAHSNLDVDIKQIDSYALTGKWLGLRGYFKAFYDSKDIPPAQKWVYRFVQVVVGIMIFILFPMTIRIIKDIMHIG